MKDSPSMRENAKRLRILCFAVWFCCVASLETAPPQVDDVVAESEFYSLEGGTENQRSEKVREAHSQSLKRWFSTELKRKEAKAGVRAASQVASSTASVKPLKQTKPKPLKTGVGAPQAKPKPKPKLAPCPSGIKPPGHPCEPPKPVSSWKRVAVASHTCNTKVRLANDNCEPLKTMTQRCNKNASSKQRQLHQQCRTTRAACAGIQVFCAHQKRVIAQAKRTPHSSIAAFVKPCLREAELHTCEKTAARCKAAEVTLRHMCLNSHKAAVVCGKEYTKAYKSCWHKYASVMKSLGDNAKLAELLAVRRHAFITGDSTELEELELIPEK